MREPGASPELLAHRRAAVGGGDHPHFARPIDPATDAEAGYPLGILWLRGLIFEADHQAGLRYAALHAAVWGVRSPKSHLAEAIRGLPSAEGADAEKQQLRLAELLGAANAALHRLPTRRPFDILLNIAVHERELRFMDSSRARTPAAWAADQRDLEALRAATDALAGLWRIGRRDSRHDKGPA